MLLQAVLYGMKQQHSCSAKHLRWVSSEPSQVFYIYGKDINTAVIFW